MGKVISFLEISVPWTSGFRLFCGRDGGEEWGGGEDEGWGGIGEGWRERRRREEKMDKKFRASSPENRKLPLHPPTHAVFPPLKF